MTIDSSLPPPAVPAAPANPNAKKIEQAAHQFEALFVGQMLRSVRESASDGIDGDGDDSGANSTSLELAEEQLAQAISARGGLGIATMVMSGLGKAK